MPARRCQPSLRVTLVQLATQSACWKRVTQRLNLPLRHRSSIDSRTPDDADRKESKPHPLMLPTLAECISKNVARWRPLFSSSAATSRECSPPLTTYCPACGFAGGGHLGSARDLDCDLFGPWNLHDHDFRLNHGHGIHGSHYGSRVTRPTDSSTASVSLLRRNKLSGSKPPK